MRSAWIAIGLTWLVTTAVVMTGVRQLRTQVREQIVRRDAEVLQAMARAQVTGDDTEALLAGEPFVVFVSIGRFEGIVAARMFDTDGRFMASVPGHVRESTVSAADLEELRAGRAVSRFDPAQPMDALFLGTNALSGVSAGLEFPAVRVLVPLAGPGGTGLAGVGEFVIEAGSVVREFELLDRRLRTDAGRVLGVALGATGLVLFWAFHQLQRSHRLLARRTGDLQRANQELAQSARVTALGAVTAHLIHGLKNPISGLRSFVAAGPERGAADTEAWQEALAATGRMQAMIQQVVRVLREHESDLDYEAGLKDVVESVLDRARPAAEARGVRLEVECDSGGTVDNRSAGLLSLLLTNLVENGIEATGSGGRVRLVVRPSGDRIVAEVSDDGPGIPATARERLFQPQPSTKEGGSGLGLAITRQLVLGLGGTLTLADTGRSGSTFRVELPGPAAPASACP